MSLLLNKETKKVLAFTVQSTFILSEFTIHHIVYYGNFSSRSLEFWSILFWLSNFISYQFSPYKFFFIFIEFFLFFSTCMLLCICDVVFRG